MGKVVSFINYKGGVGKTTVAVEIATALACHHQKKVLLIDLDPQTNATFYLMYYNEWEKWIKTRGSLQKLFEAAKDGRNLDLDSIIFPINQHRPWAKKTRFDLMPSHLHLMHVDLELATTYGLKDVRGITILRQALDDIRQQYEYIICDCPPNINFLTQNAIVASDSIVIVTKPDYLGFVGFNLLKNFIDGVTKRVKSQIEEFEGPAVKGVIFNMVRYVTGPKGMQKNGWRSLRP